MELVLVAVITATATFGASSGLWAYVIHKSTNKDSTTKLMMGLAYDKIHERGLAIIERGWSTPEEYEELEKYFYQPYKQLGGNGTAEKVMLEVAKLPIYQHGFALEILQAKLQPKEKISE